MFLFFFFFLIKLTLQACDEWPEYTECNEEEKQRLEDFGLVDDNPVFEGLYEYCRAVVGSSILCAKMLLEASYSEHNAHIEYETKQCFTNRVIFNYGGGRHHGHSDKAEGFCYVNDIVIMIDYLRQNDKYKRFERIL